MLSLYPFTHTRPTYRRSNYQVIATDYSNYSIIYSCRQRWLGFVKDERAWIMSRVPKPAEADVEIWVTELADFGYDTTTIKRYGQSNCTYFT